MSYSKLLKVFLAYLISSSDMMTLAPHYFDDDVEHKMLLIYISHFVFFSIISIMFENNQIRQVLHTDIRVPIPPALVAKITSLPPFIPIQGVPNFRDLSHDGNKLRPGYVYRSGSLSEIWGAGKSIIATELGITTIFDLRNENERQKSPSPAITGVKTIWCPYGARPATMGLLDFAGEDQGATGFVKMYNGILEAAAPCFTKIFQHIRDNPEDPFVVHCSGMFHVCYTVYLRMLASRIQISPLKRCMLTISSHSR